MNVRMQRLKEYLPEIPRSPTEIQQSQMQREILRIANRAYRFIEDPRRTFDDTFDMLAAARYFSEVYHNRFGGLNNETEQHEALYRTGEYYGITMIAIRVLQQNAKRFSHYYATQLQRTATFLNETLKTQETYIDTLEDGDDDDPVDTHLTNLIRLWPTCQKSIDTILRNAGARRAEQSQERLNTLIRECRLQSTRMGPFSLYLTEEAAEELEDVRGEVADTVEELMKTFTGSEPYASLDEREFRDFINEGLPAHLIPIIGHTAETATGLLGAMHFLGDQGETYVDWLMEGNVFTPGLSEDFVDIMSDCVVLDTHRLVYQGPQDPTAKHLQKRARELLTFAFLKHWTAHCGITSHTLALQDHLNPEMFLWYERTARYVRSWTQSLMSETIGVLPTQPHGPH